MNPSSIATYRAVTVVFLFDPFNFCPIFITVPLRGQKYA